MRRLLTGLLGAALIVSACAGDDDGDDRAAVTSIPVETTTTSTSTTEARIPPVDVIPSDPALITEEYVENVLNALYEVDLEAVTLARDEGVVDQPSIEIVESIRTSDHALEAINALIATASEGFPGYPEKPGPTTAEVSEVLEGTPECVFAEVTFDSSASFLEPPQVPANLRSFVRLRAATEQQLAIGINPTAWAIDGLPFTTDGTTPESGC